MHETYDARDTIREYNDTLEAFADCMDRNSRGVVQTDEDDSIVVCALPLGGEGLPDGYSHYLAVGARTTPQCVRVYSTIIHSVPMSLENQQQPTTMQAESEQARAKLMVYPEIFGFEELETNRDASVNLIAQLNSAVAVDNDPDFCKQVTDYWINAHQTAEEIAKQETKNVKKAIILAAPARRRQRISRFLARLRFY